MITEKQVQGKDLKPYLDQVEQIGQTVLAVVPVVYQMDDKGQLMARLFMVYHASRIILA